jgi:hypothetical protein
VVVTLFRNSRVWEAVASKQNLYRAVVEGEEMTTNDLDRREALMSDGRAGEIRLFRTFDGQVVEKECAVETFLGATTPSDFRGGLKEARTGKEPRRFQNTYRRRMGAGRGIGKPTTDTVSIAAARTTEHREQEQRRDGWQRVREGSWRERRSLS